MMIEPFLWRILVNTPNWSVCSNKICQPSSNKSSRLCWYFVPSTAREIKSIMTLVLRKDKPSLGGQRQIALRLMISRRQIQTLSRL